MTSAGSTCRSDTVVPAVRRPAAAGGAGPEDVAPRRRPGDQRRGSGDPARRAGCPRRPRRGDGARRAAQRADGAHPQGQGGLRRRQPLRGRPVRTDRQPRHGDGVRGLRHAGAARHRLPLPRVPAEGEDRRPARRARRRTSVGVRRWTTRWSATPSWGCGPPASARGEAGHRATSRSAARRTTAGSAAARARRPGVREQAEGPAAPQGRQPRPPDPAGGRRRQPSTGAPRATRSSPPTPGWRRCGSRGSSG